MMDRATMHRVGKVLFGMATMVWLAGCSDEVDGDIGEVEEAERAAPMVEVQTLEVVDGDRDRRWSGVLQPLRGRTVQARERGEIVEVVVEEGRRVEQGEVVARWRNVEEEARQRVLERRQAALQDELERWEDLATMEAAGPSEVEEARLALMEAEERLAERPVGGVLRAPVEGRISRIEASVGSQVEAGQVIMTIEDGRALGVRLEVPATETAHLDERAELEVIDEQGNSRGVEVVQFEASEAPGFVRATLWVEAGEQERPRAVEVVHRGDVEDLLVPWTAVASEEGQQWVAVVDEEGVVQRREVRLGQGRAGGIEVKQGLEEGERVIRFDPRNYEVGRQIDAVEDGP